jgi:hypothetical protein
MSDVYLLIVFADVAEHDMNVQLVAKVKGSLHSAAHAIVKVEYSVVALY